jgi:hypothetical protein
MGDAMQIEFTQQGYRQLVRALRLVDGEERVKAADAAAQIELEEWHKGGRACYLDDAGTVRVVAPEDEAGVPAAWRKLYVGPAAGTLKS